MFFSETFQTRLLSVCLILSLALMVLTALLMGAEFDEAWITASARQAYDNEAVPSVMPVTTTGGLHFLIVGATHWLPVSPLFVPRLLSLLSIVGLYIVLMRMLRSTIHSPLEYRLLAVTCVAAPGTVLLSGMGYAVVLAVALFLSGIVVVLRDDRIPLRDAAMAGILVGCAIATRWTLLPAVPALILCAFTSRTYLWRNLGMCLLAGGIMTTVFIGLLFLQIQWLEGTNPSNGVSLTTNLGSAGVGGDLPSPARMYSFLVRFVTTLPVTLLFLALTAPLIWRINTHAGRIVLILLVASLLVTGAWIARSPFMHLRYIWPVYLMVALCAGLTLVTLYRLAQTLGRKELGLAVVCFAVLLSVSQLIVAVRVIAVGAAMQINAGGYENLENHFKPFHHIQEQRAVIQYLQSLPPDIRVGMIRMPPEFGALELALLSKRDVVDFAFINMERFEGDPDLIITHRFSPFNAAGHQWLQTLGAPVEKVSGYTFYAYSGANPVPPLDEILLDPELYRFSLERWVSLTWY